MVCFHAKYWHSHLKTQLEERKARAAEDSTVALEFILTGQTWKPEAQGSWINSTCSWR